MSLLWQSCCEAETLTPFGVEIRYPDESPELLPGVEAGVVAIACRSRDVTLRLLQSYLAA
jgi:hypothetical protein